MIRLTGHLGAVFVLCLACGFRTVPASAEEGALVIDDYVPCGQVSLYAVCRLNGLDVEWEQVKELVGPTHDGGMHSFSDIASAGLELGLYPTAVHCTPDVLRTLPMPGIVHLTQARASAPEHLTVLLSCTDEGVWLIDLPRAHSFVPWANFEAAWTGKVLVFPKNEEAAKGVRAALVGPFMSTGLFWSVTVTGIILLLLIIVVLARVVLGIGSVATMASRARTVRGQLRIGLGWLRHRRRSWGSSAAVLAIVCIVVLFTQAGRVAVLLAKPPALLAEEVIDLGELALGVHTREITLGNEGGRTVLIKSMRVSCACTVVDYPPRIEPGKSGNLQVQIDVSPGPRSSRILLQTNDPKELHVITLHWLGSAIPALVPERVRAYDVPFSEPVQRVVKIVYPSSTENPISPTVERIVCDNPDVQIEVGRDDPLAFNGGSIPSEQMVVGELDLNLRISPPDSPGELQTEVTIFVRFGESEHELKLPIHANWRGTIEADQKVLTFAGPQLSAIRGQTRRVNLNRSDSGGDFSIRSCPDWMKCTLSSETDTIAELLVEVTSDPPATMHTDKILLSAEGAPDLPIAVRVFALSER